MEPPGDGGSPAHEAAGKNLSRALETELATQGQEGVEPHVVLRERLYLSTGPQTSGEEY